LLINGTTIKIKRKLVVKIQNKINSEFSDSKEIEIQNCLLMK